MGQFIRRFFDFPSAFAGALIMGTIVFIINVRCGAWPAATAAMKQAAYTFIFGGLIIKFLYGMVQYFHGLVLPVIISSLLTISLVFLVHSMKGTPLPVESTLPTAFLAPPGFFLLAWRKKRQKSVYRKPED